MSKSFSFSKINLSSLRVLYTLLLLFERDMTMEDLIKYYELYHNKKNTNFAMSKYINTCRYCGINIPKINNKYTITNFPLGVKFTQNEIALFNELKNCCEKFKLDLLSENMQNIFFKINKRSEKMLNPIKDFRQKNTVVKNFERAVWESNKIKITTKDGQSHLCDPIEILLKDDNIVFNVFENNEAREIDPKTIETVKILPMRTKGKFMPVTVLYELSGPLVKKYQLRENEQIMNFTNTGNMVVVNKHEDKDQLLHRLMRYGENCKIISPKPYVEDMKNLIKETLNNYTR